MKPDYLMTSCDRYVVGRYLSGPSEFETVRAIGRSDAADDPIKRALDVIVASVLLVLLMPLFLVVAALIRLESPGPIIFKQRRAGLGGKSLTQKS